jgi:hypothetical protein
MGGNIQDGFLSDSDESFGDEDALAMEFAWIDNYRVVFHQVSHNCDS